MNEQQQDAKWSVAEWHRLALSLAEAHHERHMV